MNFQLPLASILCLSLSWCDKLKTAAKVPVDPALQSLVDEQPEGYILRKDLPFPRDLDVRVTRRSTYKNAIAFQKSELGNQSATLSGSQETITQFKRTGDTVRFTLEAMQQVKPDPKNKGKELRENIAGAKTGIPIDFRWDGKNWKAAPSNDFKVVARGRELQPKTRSMFSDEGITPRTQWFGKKRVKIGDTISLSGDSLALVFGEGTTGSATLTFDAVEPKDGHPCGVFSVKGNFKINDPVREDGSRQGMEVTVESGKVWLSLIHPIVLREELETIQTGNVGEDGQPLMRIQGGVSMVTNREWKPAVKPSIK